MSELTKIAAILFKHLSDALLCAASELSPPDSQKIDPIIVSSEENVSLEIGTRILFWGTKNKKYWATITQIDGEKLEVQNSVLRKSWTVYKSEVLATSKGDVSY